MSDQNKIAIALVLDRSGSMTSVRNDTIEGVNKFISEQQKHEGEAMFTLVQFDHEYNIIHDYVNIKNVPLLDDRAFVPRGNTALLDAIGITINSIGDKIANMKEEDRPAQVIFAVLTDGEENHSREFTQKQIFEMIKHQTDVYKWNFVFLAADQDAIVVGSRYGFSSDSSLGFKKGHMKGVACAFSAKVRSSRRDMSNGVKSWVAFSTDDRKRFE